MQQYVIKSFEEDDQSPFGAGVGEPLRWTGFHSSKQVALWGVGCRGGDVAPLYPVQSQAFREKK
ncbi:MAG: hypothetical protein KME31_21120 [Tolypothrix carrinoi HA7290-LM1]|nr:hypothetical protein [Tolypothrix carrinoi HA7290-LM1]